MALNLSNLFTALGRIGREAYILQGAQDVADVPYNSLSGYAYVNPAWITGLTASYDASGIRAAAAGMNVWTASAANILRGLVGAESPADGRTTALSLAYLIDVMTTGSASVGECAVGSTITADGDNVGTGVPVLTFLRPDGLTQQNVVAETGRLTITADSYTGGATAGREPWSWSGAPNSSSLGTGASVGIWDWDWPQGSGGSKSGGCISASQDATASGNLLSNGDMEVWDATGTPFLDYWYLDTGTWGTDASRSTTALGGTYSVQLTAGATLTELTQQFSSSETDGAEADAGTPAALPAYTVLILGFWTKATGTISGGVLTVELTDGSGTVIVDEQGTNLRQTLALTSLSTDWTHRSFAFATPAVLPAVRQLRIRVSTALAGANLLIDDVCLAKAAKLYAGGPSLAVFSNPAAPFEAQPINDGWDVATTNDRDGATYGATWQTLFHRLFNSPETLLPYSGSPTIADSLITGA